MGAARSFDAMLLRDVVDRLDVLLPDEHGRDLGLSADLPIALLPVRLEARFSTAIPQAGRELRVRIIPDDIHVPTLDDAITAREARLANRFREAAASDPDGAWHDLVAGIGTATPRVLRAAWLAQRAAAGAVTAHDGTGLVARVLPDRWFVSAYRGSELVASATSADVRPGLTVDPQADAESAEWLTEFPKARDAGMGVKLVVDESPIDVLLAVGVRAGDGAADAQELASLLEAQRFSRGVDLLQPGTPTNNTPAVRSAWRSVPDAADVSRRELQPPPVLADDSNGRVLTNALGLAADTPALTRPAAAAATDQRDAKAMLDLLWPVTGGELLGVMLSNRMVAGKGVTQEVLEDVRSHASLYLRGRGPLPTVLVGRQPYGVLPVSSLARWSTAGDRDAAVLSGIHRRLLTGWALWETEIERLPRLGGTGDDGRATELIARMLCDSPVPDPTGYRATTVLPPNMSRTLPYLPLDGPLDADLTTGMLQVPWITLLSDTREDTRKVGFVVLPAVAPGGGQRLDSLRTGDERFLVHLALAESAKEDVLSQLAQRALLRSAERATSYVVGVKLEHPELALKLSAALVNDLGATSPTGALRLTLGNVLGVADLAAIGPGAATLAAAGIVDVSSTLGDVVTGLNVNEPAWSPEHSAAVDGVRHLQTLNNPPHDDSRLELLMGETLDLFTNRYDAWVTSLATRRLSDLRSARADGVHLGGFGWLVDLQDAETVLPGADYVHAPSPAQAATAAVLRHADIDDRAASLDSTARRFDVTSASVRVARGIMEAIAEGQPLSAVLGYRIERFLQDSGRSEHIEALRRGYGTIGGEPPAPGEAAETVPAHDVVDGVGVWRAVVDPADDRATHPPDGDVPDPRTIDGLPEHLDFLADSLADLVVAEGVHQLVTGDRSRAGATITALARGVPPPTDLHVVDSPGRHLGVPVQLLMAVGEGEAQPGGGWGGLTTRADVAPAAERLARSVLPDPSDCGLRLAAERPEDERPPETEVVTTTLADLGLCALDVLAEVGADDEHSPLAARVRLHLGRRGRMLPDPADGTTVGWGALTALARSWARVFGAARPLLPGDVTIGPKEGEGAGPPPSPAAVERAVETLTSTVAGIVSATRDLESRLATLGADPPTPEFVAAVSGPLDTFRAAGLAGTAQEPGDESPESPGIVGLVRRCVAAGVAAEQRIQQLASTPEHDHPQLEQRPARRPGGDVNELTERLAAAGRAIFGEAVVVAPAIQAERLALGNAGAVPGGDDLVDWLGELSEVRVGVRRWWQAVLATEAVTGRPPGLLPSQFPNDAGEGWIGGWVGSQRDWKPPFQARRAFVTHVPEEVPGPAVAALVVESWVEEVPVGFEHDPHRTPAHNDPVVAHLEPTGIATHFNAAGARPPQSILLAVPPDRSVATWHLGDLVATLLETIELSRFRGVGPPADLPSRNVLPAIFVPEGVEGLSFVKTLFDAVHAQHFPAATLHHRRFGDA